MDQRNFKERKKILKINKNTLRGMKTKMQSTKT